MKTNISNALIKLPDARIVIIQSKWHRDLTDKMVSRCIATLAEAGCRAPAVHVLPGALELPLAARRLMHREPSLEAVIAFGVIVKGETDHYEVVRDQCMSGFSAVMLETDIPIINEVLPVLDLKHVLTRAGDDQFNKGLEAAIAALELIEWRRRHPLE